MNVLPISWHQATLSDVCDRIVDGSHNPPKAQLFGLPMLSAKNINNRTISFDGQRLITVDDFVLEDRRTEIQKNDVLLTIVATIGRVAVVGDLQPFALQRSVAVLRSSIIDSRYLAYNIESPLIQKLLMDNAKGTAQKGIYLKALGKLSIPIAPIKEQQRIADKLDILLARVDACRQRLDRVSLILKRFRQSVLAAATSGDLTADWRDHAVCKTTQQMYLNTSDNASDMGADTAMNDFSNITFELPNSWKWKNLAHGISQASYGTSSKSTNTGSMPVLRMGNLQGGKLDWDNLVYSENEKDNLKYALAAGDLLFNRTNSPELVGKTSLYLGERPAIYAGYLIRIRCKPHLLLSEYVNFCLNSPYGRAYCWAVKSDGVSQSNINAEKLRAFPVPYCDVTEQTEIVRRVEILFAFADRLETRLAKVQTATQRLTPALLAKAFRGELVPQDSNDEPASELLKRSAASRAAGNDKPRRGRAAQV